MIRITDTKIDAHIEIDDSTVDYAMPFEQFAKCYLEPAFRRLHAAGQRVIKFERDHGEDEN